MLLVPVRAATKSGELRLALGRPGQHLAFTQLVGPDGRNWLGAFSGGDVVWKLVLKGPNNAVKEITSADARLSAVDETASRRVLSATVPVGENAAALVKLTIRASKDRSLSYWSLSAALPEGWRVIQYDFPVLPNIRVEKGLKMAAPYGWGLEYDVKQGMAYDGAYPSACAAMQFVAFYRDGQGLYVGIHDPKGRQKSIIVRAGADLASFDCRGWAAVDAKAGGTFTVPFDAAIGTFAGDYYDAAQIYRDFTFSADWGKAGPVSKRVIPQWLKNNDLWLMSELSPMADMRLARQSVDYFGQPFSFHWYRWHQIPQDVLFPDYFPPKPGFAGGVEELQGMGIDVMPYINGRIADPNSRQWSSEHLEKAAVKLENGSLFPEEYVPKALLDVMCPSAAQWQDKIAEISGRLATQYGVNGVYIDQIGAAGPLRCFDPSHGHPLGGDLVWTDGYRTMLDKIRGRLPSEVALTTEEDAECYIDKFDAQLLVNTPTSEQTPIPLFPSVYSGRVVTFGFQYVGRGDFRRSLPFRAKMARAFVWGSQVGWVRTVDVLAPDSADEAEFLRNLAHCRRFGHQFVVTGKFLGMLDAQGDNPRVQCDADATFGGLYKIDLPTVLASQWLAEDGSIGVLLANMSDEPRSVTVTPRGTEAKSSAKSTFRIFGPDGLISAARTTSVSQTVTVPARSALILSMEGKE